LTRKRSFSLISKPTARPMFWVRIPSWQRRAGFGEPVEGHVLITEDLLLLHQPVQMAQHRFDIMPLDAGDLIADSLHLALEFPEVLRVALPHEVDEEDEYTGCHGDDGDEGEIGAAAEGEDVGEEEAGKVDEDDGAGGDDDEV